MGLITLTTDFGVGSAYVAQLKGVLLSAAPKCRIVDVSHSISPQNIREAALLLRGTAFAFPTGTVHVVVVDPGVGTNRRPIAISAKGMFFVGPDNGVLGHQASMGQATVVHLNKPHLFRQPVSKTFHGRDIFAPVAAELANGIALVDVGTPIKDPEAGILGRPQYNNTTVTGTIVGADNFGNLLTNIPGPRADKSLKPQVLGHNIPWVSTYGEAELGQLIALEGSDGFIEIAIREGSALEVLGEHSIGAACTCYLGESNNVD